MKDVPVSTWLARHAGDLVYIFDKTRIDTDSKLRQWLSYSYNLLIETRAHMMSEWVGG